ncbi:MAG TPA: hypothetical protein PKD55_10555 [Bellilinea sp.]|jgi:hypothetical protein|nr:hypothetical protein [Bellilinea sp.]
MTVADKEHEQKGHNQDEKKVGVAIATTSGFYPETGFIQVPVNQKVEVELQRAAKAIDLTDTSNWVAKVAGRTIDPNQSYAENQLSGEVEIDWGPREGGGGQRDA